MKKDNLIIGINLGDYGSTGNIMRSSLEYAHEHGNYDYLVIVPKSENKPNTYAYAYPFSKIQRIIHRILKSETKPQGYRHYFYSRRILKKIKQSKRDYENTIVHLHNLHYADIDIKALFKGLAKLKVDVIYTLHDCWAFTGGCYHYGHANCDKWKTGCQGSCPLNFGNKKYPVSRMCRDRFRLTSCLKEKILFVPVSKWLEDELKQSCLKSFLSIVNHGECGLSSSYNRNNYLREKYHLDNKKIILTISAYWEKMKGIDKLFELINKLPNDYVLIVIGKCLEGKHFSNALIFDEMNHDEIYNFYLSSDCYAHISPNDNLPLVLMEAQICGLPVVGFGNGGTPEEIIEGKTGYMLGGNNDVDALIEKIKYVCEQHPFKKEDIIANGMRFKKDESSKRYLEIYNKTAKEEID